MDFDEHINGSENMFGNISLSAIVIQGLGFDMLPRTSIRFCSSRNDRNSAQLQSPNHDDVASLIILKNPPISILAQAPSWPHDSALPFQGVRSPQMGVLGQGFQQTLVVLQLSQERTVLLSMPGVLAVYL